MLSDDPSFGILEWAAKTTPGCDDIDHLDESVWAACIPTLGHPGGADIDVIRDDARALPQEDFCREYLSIPTGSPLLPPIGAHMWSGCRIQRLPPRSELRNVVLGVDTSPNQQQCSITVSGTKGDRLYSALAGNYRGDTGLLAEVQAIARQLRPMTVVLDQRSPAAQMQARLERGGVRVSAVGAADMAESCAGLYTQISSQSCRIVADDALTAAATGAVKRHIADVGWAWNRRDGSALDITPLVALSLSSHRSDSYPR